MTVEDANTAPRKSKPLAKIWEGFTRSKRPGKKHYDGECKACGTMVRQGQPNRELIQHILKCEKIFADARAVLVTAHMQELENARSFCGTPLNPRKRYA